METIKLRVGNRDIESTILNDEVVKADESNENVRRLGVRFSFRGSNASNTVSYLQEQAKKSGVQTVSPDGVVKEWLLANHPFSWKGEDERASYEVRWTLEEK